MTRIRRPLASCALAVLIIQLGLLVGMPVSACCRTAATPSKSSHCCKTSADTSQPCPMHPRAVQRDNDCRIVCTNRDDEQLVLGVFGTLPTPASVSVPLISQRIPVPSFHVGPSRVTAPDSPPPEARRS